MKHSLNIISFSTLWFQICLDAGPADQMVHGNIMLLKWRLEFRSTGHRTTEADCNMHVIYSARKGWGWQMLLYCAAEGQTKCRLLMLWLCLSMWLLIVFLTSWGRGLIKGWFREVREIRDTKEVRQCGRKSVSQVPIICYAKKTICRHLQKERPFP